ncbi:cystathionine beta-lyase MetC [Bacillus sp. HMF5848]|uniref:cystathionine beta-lyase n=1 Tax=Bacillus sp. HMF5848 TaxID=2495421 RepID=UPI000F776FA9|nr:cystathionine beta-lyase [Bacillus sp. HMF5848]RSK26662.1 cystathionine beta-lyase MetC [Bacillus sp. HMF5848]
MSKYYSLQTRLLHNTHKVDKATGAVSVPIQHASTFHQDSFDDFGKYDYARSGNPTREALEIAIAELEGGGYGFAFSSGMAAISTAFMMLRSGDHVLIPDDVYGGTFRFITEVLSRFQIEHTFVDMTNLALVETQIRPNTKVIYIETPSNPLLKVTDIKAIVALAKQYGCLTYVDNTFMTPACQRPLELDVDVVLHSATKFLSGHSDVVAGLAVVKDKILAKEMRFLQNSFGAILGVQDCWLVLRGLKTLHIRLQQSIESAIKLARFLENHSAVREVNYPGLESHPGHTLQCKQASSFGAVLSFSLQSEDDVRQLLNNIEIPVFAVSLGAVESILSYPAKMSHEAMPKEERHKRGISDGLLRLSVGLENVDDLIEDFANALDAIVTE